jgi:hypothetical protein
MQALSLCLGAKAPLLRFYGARKFPLASVVCFGAAVVPISLLVSTHKSPTRIGFCVSRVNGAIDQGETPAPTNRRRHRASRATRKTDNLHPEPIAIVAWILVALFSIVVWGDIVLILAGR